MLLRKTIQYTCLAVVATSPLAIVSAQSVDQIRACVNERKKEFEQPKSFKKSGKVHCEQAYIYDRWDDLKLPECRGKEARANVTYTPGPNKKISSARVVVKSNINGSHADPRIGFTEDGQHRVSIGLYCKSAEICPGGPGAGIEVDLVGEYVNEANDENIMQWTIECSR